MPPAMRPCPPDFAEMSRKINTVALCQHYGAGPSMISRWRREVGMAVNCKGGVPPRPVPDDFTIDAATTYNDVLAARYGTSVSTVSRWRRETGIPSPFHAGRPKAKGVYVRPVPEGFAENAPTMTTKALASLYKASGDTVRRWRKVTGAYFVKPPPVPKPPRRVHEPKPAKVCLTSRMGRPRGQIFYCPPRDTSIEGQAAEALRAYAPTYRCNERGRQDCAEARKRWWRYGNVVLTPDELLQRAAAKGWRAEA